MLVHPCGAAFLHYRKARWRGPFLEIQAAFGLPDSSKCGEVSGLFSALLLSAGMLARTFPVSLILAIQSASHFANSVFLAPSLILPSFCWRLNIGAVKTSWMRIEFSLSRNLNE